MMNHKNNRKLTDKHVENLIRASQENSATPEEAMRKLAHMAWEHAQSTPWPTAAEKATTFFSSQQEMKRELQSIKNIIHLTVNKLTLPTPAEFNWAFSSGAEVVGIYRADKEGTKYEITSDVQSGKTKPTKDDFICVQYDLEAKAGRKGKAFIPVTWFSLDPVLISQYVRNQTKAEALARWNKNVEFYEKQKTKLEKEINHAEFRLKGELNRVSKHIDELNSMSPFKVRKPRTPRNNIIGSTVGDNIVDSAASAAN